MFCGVALNPVVKFSHIKKHWDAEYVDQATEWVQDEASYTLSSVQLLMHHCLQLEKYHCSHVLGGSSCEGDTETRPLIYEDTPRQR